MRRAAAATLVGLTLACGDAAAQDAASPGAGAAARRFAELASRAEARGDAVVAGDGGMLLLASELRHLGLDRFWGDAAASVSRAAKPAWADPLPAIVDFARQLEGRGIELLFVPVPAKAALVPEALDVAASPRPDASDAAFYEALRAEGVEVLDLRPALLAGGDAAAMVCRTDSHWSGRGAEVAAAAIAERIRQRPWYAYPAGVTIASERRDVTFTGDLARMAGGGGASPETLSLRFVGRSAPGVPLEPLAPSRSSPVLLLADSHGLVFHAGGDMHARGAGLPDQLALELGFPVDLLAVRGSGATPSRMALARRRGGLAGKQLVVWVLSVREFTESTQGWRKVPVVR